MSIEKIVKELKKKEIVLIHNVSGVEFGEPEYALMLYSGEKKKDKDTGIIHLEYIWMAKLLLSKPELERLGFSTPEIDEEVKKVLSISQPRIIYSKGGSVSIDPKRDKIYKGNEIKDVLNITEYHTHFPMIEEIVANYIPVEIMGEKGKGRKKTKK